MPLTNTQSNWRWCTQCQGLWFAGNGTRGACPAGGGLHVSSGSENFNLVVNSPADAGQHGWRWCNKCEGLWYAHSEGARSWCPYDETTHSQVGSGDYSIEQQPPTATGQDDWRGCSQCQGLWFAGGTSKGRCPKYGAPHTAARSGSYRLVGAPLAASAQPAAHVRANVREFERDRTRRIAQDQW
jgi:hypothetical protein